MARKKQISAIARENIPSEFIISKLPPIWYDQQNTNSCVGQSLAFALSLLVYRHFGLVVHFSPFYIYWHARYLRGLHYKDDGAYVEDGVKAVKRWWACEAAIWENRDEHLFLQPTPAAYENAFEWGLTIEGIPISTIEEMKTMIYRNLPVVFGFYVPSSFRRARQGGDIIVDIPSPDEKILGGHAVVAIGYSDLKQAFLCRNSWGRQWGNDGNFWLTYKFFEKGLAMNAFAIDIRRRKNKV